MHPKVQPSVPLIAFVTIHPFSVSFYSYVHVIIEFLQLYDVTVPIIIIIFGYINDRVSDDSVFRSSSN